MADPRPGRPSLRPRAAAGDAATGSEAALDVARRALGPLREVTALDRGRALVAVAADVEDRRAQFVDEVRRAGGGRFSEAVGVVDGLVDDTVRWAGWADKLDLLAPGWPGSTRPPGVVAVRPAGGSLRDLAGAVAAVLLTGGTVLLADGTRPAGLLVAAVLARFPAGCVQVVPEDADLPVRTTFAAPATDGERVLDLLDPVSLTFAR